MGTFYPCVHQTHLECFLLKSSFLFTSEHRSQSHLKFQLCLTTEYTRDCFLVKALSFLDFFFLKPSQTTCQNQNQLYSPSVRKHTRNLLWFLRSSWYIHVYIHTYIYTVSSTNIGTLGKYDQRRL